ncbi:MAG: M48 family metalloprotease [Armatimonadetes bacterium]|nr:M48 family metalloprotease [Armatimonadota bacterium]
MKPDEYKGWVERYGRLALEDSVAYERSVSLWLAVGTLFYVCCLTASLVLLCLTALAIRAGTIGSLWRLGLIGGVLFYALVRSLLVRLEPPVGRILTMKEAPRLFEELDRVRERINCPRVHSVVLVTGVTAFAAISTRFGPFGRRLHVGIGVPLLAMMPTDQFLAVQAHELGHHARRHTVMGTKTAIAFQIWQETVRSLSKIRSVTVTPIASFARWYLPRLDAVTVAVRKRHEFEADATAKELKGEAAAGALVRLTADEDVRLKRYFSELRSMPRQLPTPPSDYFERMQQIAQGGSTEGVADQLTKELRLRSEFDSSHPSLSERLRALGVSCEPDDGVAVENLVEKFAGPPDSIAGEDLLGDSWPSIRSELDEFWREQASDWWAEERRTQKEAEAALAEKASNDPLDIARALWEVSGPEAAWDELSQALKANPSDPETRFATGSCAVQTGRSEGVELLRSLLNDPHYRVGALRLLYEYFRQAGMADDANETYEALMATEVPSEPAAQILTQKDSLSPRELSDDEREGLARVAAKVPGLLRAYAFDRRSPGGTGIGSGLALVFKPPLFVPHESDFCNETASKVSQVTSFGKGVTWWILMEGGATAKWVKRKKELTPWTPDKAPTE